MSSPVLWGSNNLSNNLQGGELLSSGTLLNYNGPKNYITLGNFENQATTGWSLGTIGTLTNGLPTGTPTFGSGAAGTLAITAVTTGQLAGTASLSYASSAATTVGNMVASQAYTIDIEDQAKVLTFKFYYSPTVGSSTANWSGTSSNSFGVAFYDVTNGVWLPQSANFGMTQSTGVGYCTGTLQTGTTTASIRMVVYNVTATTGAVTVLMDDFFVGPQTAPVGYVGTDWVQYVPTFTGFGTVTAISFYSKRVGDSLMVHGQFTIGTPTATPNAISLGYNGANGNVAVDTTKLLASSLVGDAISSTAATTYFRNAVIGANVSSTTVSITQQSNAVSATTGSQNGSALFVAGVTVSMEITVPIVGWSSNIQMSADTDTRVISFSGQLAATQATTANVTNIAFPSQSDTAGAWNGTQYVVPIAGNYSVSTVLSDNGTTTNSFAVYLNGAMAKVLITGVAGQLGGGNALLSGLKPGDLISIRTNQSTTLGPAGSLSIFRLSGPAVVAATESVSARYFSSSSTITSTLSTIAYSTKGWDTHNAYNTSTGLYTAPSTGYYQVNASVASSGTYVLNSTAVIQIVQTGVNTQTTEQDNNAANGVTSLTVFVGDVFYMIAGDQVQVKVSNNATTPAIIASTSRNWFSIAKVGKGN